ncbi:ANL_HP_G0146540.mRNA.1.CDS.1 [Saccharomyces cerevisiae]|nr:ANL_HP_G0146540.mRNA.1.CDS.1 [Saccharomyces cerevisiae]CAI7009181.1 ANL_HP_G0146540.mRNA.1.CDS.1 [Saccharomyces cerevisiae]
MYLSSVLGYKVAFIVREINTEYTANVPYVAMRFFSATLGIVSVLVLYLTLRVSGVKIAVAAICATVAEVAVGSAVSLNHVGTAGGYLHSHLHNYPAGSMQQQVTLYPHIDQNNNWIIELAEHPNENVTSFQNLTDGTIIKLRQLKNGCRLHSHDHKPPVSQNADWQKEVSCYGYEGFEGDINDDWIIEIDKKRSEPGPAQEHIRAIETKFRLKHYLTGCYLFSHPKTPEFGDSAVVTCASVDRTSHHSKVKTKFLPNPEGFLK